MIGYIRVGNFRGDKDYAPEPDEVAIAMDRSHPVLGNRHYLKNRNDPKERHKVIELFDNDCDKDEAENGPISKAINELALRVISGEKIVGMCWCFPKDCHVNRIIARIDKKIKKHQQIHI